MKYPEPEHSHHPLRFDGLGSVVALTDGAGNVVNRYAYDPYGNVTSSVEAVANPWRFGGSYGAYTDGTGLVKIGQRYYDPGVGHWTQQDPKVMPFDPVQANRYGYAGCSPTNFTDPSGLDWRDAFWDYGRQCLEEGLPAGLAAATVGAAIGAAAGASAGGVGALPGALGGGQIGLLAGIGEKCLEILYGRIF